LTISAVFLDRDGVLNEYLPGDYVKTPHELRVMPGASSAIRQLNDAGLPVVVISNQQGVGKRLMSRDDLDAVEQALRRGLHAEAGAWLDRCYYCTDLKSANSPRRKPAPGMLLEAAHDLGIEPRACVMVGDSPSDIAAAKAAGVGAAVLILSGATREYRPGDMSPAPDQVFSDLQAAINWIIQERQQ
jgi:D-glycero-D-manno-heptose 1,7-bisphosphate phosphatase